MSHRTEHVTHNVALLERINAFLPRLKEANEQLAGASVDSEAVEIIEESASESEDSSESSGDRYVIISRRDCLILIT